MGLDRRRAGVAWAVAAAIMVALIASPCEAAVADPKQADDPSRVRAPDFAGADSWLNTDNGKPVSIKDLRGQVVLLDFWTYCCINCMHVFPELHEIEQKFKDQPVVVIGIHSGKFDQEKDAGHIRQAILRHNITHPVAVDSQYKIWNAYGVQAWPTLILIDPEGYAVAGWSGEGDREAIEARIANLLQDGKARGILAKPMHFHAERDSFKSGNLEFPGKVLADGAGKRLFISDSNHNRVLIADLDGNVSRVIGSAATGLKDGSFVQSEFHQPQGLALSTDGKTLYIADTENHAVRVANLAAATVLTLAGDGQQGHIPPDNTPATTVSLSSPWDLARVENRLYIAMAGVHQIWAMDLDKGTLSVFAGTGREGAVDGDNRAAGFAQPSGLSADAGILYVADAEASSLRAVTLKGQGGTRTIAGSGDLFGFGLRDGIGRGALLQHPLGVAVSGDNLFVADSFNNVIRRLDLRTGQLDTWLGSGKTDPGPDSAPNFYEPGGLSVAGTTLYIADTNHHRIVAVDIATKKAKVLTIELPKAESGRGQMSP